MNIPATISIICIITGCFLPWIQLGALINNRGINNPDAMIILGASIVGLIISIATKKKWALLNLLVGLVCGFVAMIDYRDVTERVASSTEHGGLFSLSVSVGSGLYLVLIGSGLLILISVIDAITGDKKNKPIVLSRDGESYPLNDEESVQQRITEQTSIADELKKYKELLDNGAITEAEYNLIKARLLS